MANTSGVQAPIGAGQTMNADAARYWLALVAAIKAETGITVVPTEGTRLYARQKYLYDGYRAGRPGFNPAWPPDSPYAYHLSGRAVDVGSGVGYLATQASREFYARAGRYGFRPTVAGEPWHFEWRADWVGVSLEAAGTVQQVIPSTTSEEDDMNAPALIQRDDSMKRLAAVGLEGSGYVVIRNEAHYAELANLYNATGVKLRTKSGLVSWPAWSKLSGNYVTLSPTGYDEALLAYTPRGRA